MTNKDEEITKLRQLLAECKEWVELADNDLIRIPELRRKRVDLQKRIEEALK